MTLPILYSFRRCPYAMRARLAIASAGVECELREVVLRDKPPELREVSPKATVPVLVLEDGRVLEESLDIMLWALEQSDPEGWLRGWDEDAKALVETNDGPFKRSLDRYKYPSRYPDEPPKDHRAEASRALRPLEARLARGPYLSGAAWGLLDTATAPFVRQFAKVDFPAFAAAHPDLVPWLESFLNGSRLARVMSKYAPWRAGAPGPRFPPAP